MVMYIIDNVTFDQNISKLNKQQTMVDDICVYFSMAVCFDFRLSNVVQLSNWFRCHHPLITQLVTVYCQQLYGICNIFFTCTAFKIKTFFRACHVLFVGSCLFRKWFENLCAFKQKCEYGFTNNMASLSKKQFSKDQ